MPILSNTTEKNAPDRVDSAILGGTRVDYAINKNKRDKQQDRASVMELKGVEDYPQFIAETIAAAEKAARVPPLGSTFDTAKGMDVALWGQAKDRGEGQSTFNMMVFDPQRMTVDTGSRGDSLLLLVLDDHNPDHNPIILPLSEADIDVIAENTPRSLNQTGSFVRGKLGKFSGTLPLDTIIERAINQYDMSKEPGFDPEKLEVSLLLTSDGIPNGLGDEDGIGHAIRDAGKQNAAQALVENTINRGGGDNLSAVLLRDVAHYNSEDKKWTGRGSEPLTACVCDGFWDAGHHIAQRGISVFEEKVRSHAAAAEQAPPPTKPEPFTRRAKRSTDLQPPGDPNYPPGDSPRR